MSWGQTQGPAELQLQAFQNSAITEPRKPGPGKSCETVEFNPLFCAQDSWSQEGGNKVHVPGVASASAPAPLRPLCAQPGPCLRSLLAGHSCPPVGATNGVVWFGYKVFCKDVPAGRPDSCSSLGPSISLFQIPTPIPLVQFPSGFGNVILNVVFLAVPGSIHACNPHVPPGCLASQGRTRPQS